MLILVSPAKTLDFENNANTQEFTRPQLLNYSEELIEICRQLTPADIASLMKVSDKIAALNVARFTCWQPKFTLENAKQAIFAFKGDVYTGLDAESMSKESLQRSQSQLRILSGLYGLLRPLDLMQPYRLEMGTSLANHKGKNLYQFWGDVITNAINQTLVELESTHSSDDTSNDMSDDLVVNLASNEYFKAVNKKTLQGRLITPVFKDYKNGQYKVISFYAKRARGMMARFLLDNQVHTLEKLQQFTQGGYYHESQASTPEAPVFYRDQQ